MKEDLEEYQEQNAVLRSLRQNIVGGWCYPEIKPARFDGDVAFAALEERIAPTAAHGEARDSTTHLVLPFQTRNHSTELISARLHHEWHGGEWPQTDLYIYQPEMFRGRVHPVYLVGEDGGEKWIHLRPSQSIRLDLRMDWPGTGSVFAVKLMDASAARDYVFRFVLVFSSGGFGQKYHALSQRIVVGMT